MNNLCNRCKDKNKITRCGKDYSKNGFGKATLIMGIVTCMYTIGAWATETYSRLQSNPISMFPVLAIYSVITLILAFISLKKLPKNRMAISGMIMGVGSFLIYLIF